MKLASWLGWGVVLVAAVHAACGGSAFTSHGVGGAGAGSAGGATASATGSGGGPDCSQCGTTTVCVEATCEGGVCGKKPKASGTPTGSQVEHDCKQVVCDGQGSETIVADPSDPCAANKFCNDEGNCVDCLKDSDCTDAEICGGGDCQPASCADGTQNGLETDLDCGGGQCSPCKTGQKCNVAGDCKSGVCTGNVCKGASCDDGVENGGETDIDCGGMQAMPCPKCADGQKCHLGPDCQSGVCEGGSCEMPGCSDMVMNGNETDVDCGGDCPTKCGDMQMCNDDGDCASGSCTSGSCVSQCANGKQDGNETDVDCGGGTCQPCPNDSPCMCASDCESGNCCGTGPSDMTCTLDIGMFCSAC